ncbi:MAG: hypothetical protein ACREP9_04360 [Candidatus Dormibacteraceae bacterium]
MSRLFSSCTRGFGTAALATGLLLAFPAAQAQRDSNACDRACLKQMLDAYLGAVFKHDPGAVALTADHYATENTSMIKDGEGFWKEFNAYGAVKRGFFDPLNGSAAFLGVLKQTGGEDRIASVRIKVEGGKVSEAEWIVASQGPGGRGEANPEGLVQYPPPDGPLPRSERSSRFMMKSLVNDFYQAVVDHYGDWVPNDPMCYRIENGGGKSAAQGNGAPTGSMMMPPYPKDGCLANFEAFDKSTRDIALRRFPLIDEEAGVVLCAVIFVRYPGVNRQDNLVHEYIQIRRDKVHAWWTSMYFLPLGSPVTSGWENRHGIWH